MINIEKAKLSPGDIFKSPMSVVNCDEISREEKIDILCSWAYEERELQVADNENMSQRGFERPNKLDEILRALAKLGISSDQEHGSPPTEEG